MKWLRALICIAALGVAPAAAWRSGIGVQPFNNGKSQVAQWFSQTSGDFPTLNLFKNSEGWQSGDPSKLDANGYPNDATILPANALLYVPTQTERPGNYVLTWDGTGTTSVAGAAFVSGSFTSSGGAGAGRVVVAPTSGANNAITIGITAIGSSSNYISNIKFFHVNDETAINAGQIWGAQFLAKLRQGNFGVIRFLDQQSANTSNVTTWATRKPVTYAWWGAQERRGSIYAGATTNVGDDYSITFGTGGPVDKQTIILQFNASATGTSPTLNLNGTGAVQMLLPNGGSMVGFTNRRPVANTYATLVYDAFLGGWIKFGGDTSGQNQYLENGVPPEMLFNLALTLGAHPYFVEPYLTADPITDYMSSLAAYEKANAPAWMIPRFEGPNETWNSQFNSTGYGNVKQFIRNGGTQPNGGAAPTYNVTNIAWTGTGATGTSTLTISGALPPVGANVQTNAGWPVSGFSSTNMYVSSVNAGAHTVTVNRAPTAGTNPSAVTQTIAPINGTNFHDWYGQVISDLGQAVNAIYGGTPSSQTKYQVLAGVQTSTGTAGALPNSVPRIASTSYAFRGGSPAYNWITHLANAQYFSPSERGTNQELVDGYAYVVTNAANPTAQAAAAAAYVATADTLTPGPAKDDLTSVATLYANWKAWGLTFAVPITRMTGYEGGYSPDYSQVATTSSITAATQANPCVLTLPTTDIQGGVSSGGWTNSNSSTPAAVVGMQLTIAGVVGMTQLNGNTYTIAGVSGTSVTINVDASAFTAYSSGGTATYVSAPLYLNTLRYAGKFTPNLAGYTFGGVSGSQSNYQNFVNAGGEFPSQYNFSGSSSNVDVSKPQIIGTGEVWGAFDPDIYATPSTAWNGIVSFNH